MDYVAPDWRMKQLCDGGACLYMVPQSGKPANITEPCNGGEMTLFLLGSCPTLAPWEDSVGRKANVQCFALAQLIHLYPPCGCKDRF